VRAARISAFLKSNRRSGSTALSGLQNLCEVGELAYAKLLYCPMSVGLDASHTQVHAVYDLFVSHERVAGMPFHAAAIRH